MITEIKARNEAVKGFEASVEKMNPDSQLALVLAYGHLKMSRADVDTLLGMLEEIKYEIEHADHGIDMKLAGDLLFIIDGGHLT
jgi:hypothetical protein